MFRFVAGIVLGCMLIDLAVSSDGEPLAGPSIAEQELRALLRDVHTLKAEFVQTLFQPQTGQEKVASGTFYLARPDRFRWEYRNPPQLIIADGDTIWLYDPELEQASFRGQESALQGTPAQLLVDTRKLEEIFAVTGHGSNSEVEWVELTPRAEDSEFVRVRVAFSEGSLFAMDMEDQFGQRTLIEFSRVEYGPELDPKLFEYKPPSGIDVFGG